MAFSFDSALALSAALLCAIAVLVWRMAGGRIASARLNLRFGAMLLAALGVAGAASSWNAQWSDIAFAVGLLVIALAPVALALSLFQPRPAPAWGASLTLVAGFACGLAAALGDAPVLALTSLTLSSSAMILMALARWRETKRTSTKVIAGALALFLGGMALMDGAIGGALLLLAAGLLGVASEPRVQQQAGATAFAGIGRPRL